MPFLKMKENTNEYYKTKKERNDINPKMIEEYLGICFTAKIKAKVMRGQ